MKGTMNGVYKAAPAPGAEFRTDLPIPAIGARDILLKVQATAICGTDLHILPWTQYAQARVKTPLVFGHEFAGDVVEIGSGVTEIKVGDRVAGETHIPCNECAQCANNCRHICENMQIIGVHTAGSFAQYIAFPVDCAYKIPDGMDYSTAALLEPMGVAMHGIDAADIRGKTAVVYGCGPIGLMAVGIGKAWEAKQVIAIDVFDAKLAVARKMGADMIINAKSPDLFAALKSVGDIDVVIDYTGNAAAIRSGLRMLKKGGRFVLVGLPDGDVTLPLTEDIIYKETTLVGVTGRLMYKTWQQCIDVLGSGRFSLEPVIGGRYKLSDYQAAFETIVNGAPGKMLLFPWGE